MLKQRKEFFEHMESGGYYPINCYVNPETYLIIRKKMKEIGEEFPYMLTIEKLGMAITELVNPSDEA